MRGAVILLLAAVSPPLLAQVLAPQYPGGYRPSFEEGKPWQEQQASLPPYPDDARLIRFEVSAISSFDFFVDPESITVGEDGVTRYTLVARSRGGSTNVSYEGIRCGTFEQKIYAFGRADHTWSPAHRSEWAPMSRYQVNSQRATLAEEFLCSPSGAARTAEETIVTLKRAMRQ